MSEQVSALPGAHAHSTKEACASNLRRQADCGIDVCQGARCWCERPKPASYWNGTYL